MKAVAVDFDGVLHQYTHWTPVDRVEGPPVEGAVDWLNRVGRRYWVVVHTARAREPGAGEAVGRWLAEQGVRRDFAVTAEKPDALIYLDDRAWRFQGAFPTLNEIGRFTPWKPTHHQTGESA